MPSLYKELKPSNLIQVTRHFQLENLARHPTNSSPNHTPKVNE